MKFGARLRAAREARGMTLREISARTRISLAHFEALERDEISRLPGGIFSRAFVRAYATEVGLDPEATVQEFLEAFSEDGLTAGRAQIEIEDNQAIESQRRAARTVVKLLIVSIPLVMTLMYFTLAGDEPVSSPPPSTASATRDLKPPPDAPPLPVQSAVGAAVRDEAIDARMENLEVVLRSSRECWVSAAADGSVLFATTMIAGEERTVRAERNLALRIGDAGAMTLFINGERATPIGGNGQVVTIRVTPENYRRLLNGR